MTAKAGTRIAPCGICPEGTYIATGFGTGVCDKNPNHQTTSWGGDFNRTPLATEDEEIPPTESAETQPKI